MLKNFSVKTKLWVLVGLPLIATIIITSISTFYVSKINSDLKQDLNEEGFKTIGLTLNSDRDIYQALTAFRSTLAKNISDPSRSEDIKDFKENIDQTNTRIAEARKLLETDKSSWNTYRYEKSNKSIFEYFDDFNLAFSDWVNNANSYIEGNGVITDLDNKFDIAREDLNIIGEMVEYQVGQSIIVADKNKNNMIITLITINVAVLILAFIFAFILFRYITGSLDKVSNTLTEISNGNLDVTIDIYSRDEIGRIAESSRLMVENLNSVLATINSSAEQVAGGAKNVSDSSMALSQGATEQASSIQQLTASIEELASQTKQNAGNATQANELAEIAKLNAVQGNAQMREMLNAMDEINSASNSISKIIKVIDEIAFQTNILALNAAVEAARAGQHGKGFAVVAEEVRNLAARSANAAKETTSMIEGSITKVEGGTRIANETAEALNKIVDRVAKVSTLLNDIASASNEQATGIAQINQGVSQISQVIQTNSATSEEGAAASEELSSQADLLKEQVSRFKLKKSSQNYKGFEEINPAVIRMLENRLNNSGNSKSKITLNDNDFGKY